MAQPGIIGALCADSQGLCISGEFLIDLIFNISNLQFGLVLHTDLERKLCVITRSLY